MKDPSPQTISRREAMLRLASTIAAAGGLGLGVAFFRKRTVAGLAAVNVPDWRLPEVTGFPIGAAARGPNPIANLQRALAAVGGIERFVKPDARVLIKPNVGWDRLPEQAANTDPLVVAELARLCLAAGAREVVVTDISCNDPRRCFERSGIKPAALAVGAIVIESHKLRMIPAQLGGYSVGLDVIEPLIKADCVINVPVVKHHSLSKCTLGMKNWFGVLGSGRNRLHQDIHRAVAELGAMFRPTLTVVDATRVLMANGPQGGSLGDVKNVNAVAVGVDVVACDAWGVAILGHDPQRLGFLTEAEQRGLGRANAALIKELGTV